MRITMLAAAVAVVMLAPAAISARTLYVANDGFDEPGCGTKVAPCRSISEAITLASHNDRIEVGPGAYGDLDEDGSFDGAGEESAEIGAGTCNCLVKIDKSLTITSKAGAGSTLIKVGRTIFTTGISIVRIQSDDVIFGRRNKGFHITAAQTPSTSIGSGIATDQNIARITIEGNLITSVATGISIGEGDDHMVSDNTASNNTIGIFVDDIDNIVVRNNVVINNRRNGILTDCSGGLVEHNQVVQNLMCGIRSEISNVGTICMSPKIFDNNIYGNGTQSAAPGFLPLNCGFLAIASTITILPELEGNYWGAADGPGPDPADEAIAADASSAFPVDVFSFARSPVRIQGIR